MQHVIAPASWRKAWQARLKASEAARERRTDRFATRMRAIATRAETTTGRDMTIRDPAIAFTTENDTGIVDLHLTWTGLAAQEDDQLVLRNPFASGFDIDRPVRVVGPDGYELVTVTPEPTTQQQNSATWSAATAFDGFETTFAPAEGGTVTDTRDGTSGAGAPGFGIGIATVALLAGTALVVVHRRLDAR